MTNPCAVCGEEMDPVYACRKPHATASGAIIGSAIHACPVQKGAIWVHVIDDAGDSVKGVSVTSSVGGTKESDGSGFSPFDPLDEGNAYKITLNPLSDKLAEKYRLPEGKEVPNVPVSTGQITSVQLRLERVAPLKVIVMRSDNDAFIKDIEVDVTTTVPRNAPAKATEKTPDGGTVEFPKLAQGSYKVTLKLSDEDKKRWRVVDADTQDWTLDPATGAKNEVTFKLTPIIQIFLKLQFKDPEDNARNFPKGFKFNLDFEAGPEPRKREVVVNDKGIATADGKDFVEVERAAKSFKIDLKQAAGVSVVCENRGAAKKQELVEEDDPEAGALVKKLRTEGRMFRLPIGDWTLLNSRWEVDAAPIKGGASLDTTDYKFKDIDSLPAAVGAAGTPALLTLKPAWQFMRFVYYDRKLKGDDPLSVPAKPWGDTIGLVIGGWRDKADETANKAADALALWPQVDDDAKNVLCLPWIVGKGGSNEDAKIKPDKDTLLRFKRAEAYPYIQTESATDRRLIDFDDDKVRDKPSVKRLAYYDLPKVWKSRGYFGWLSDADGDWGPYEDIAEKDTTAAKPLVFSLDDMVLTDERLAPVMTPWDKTKRVALLSHKFTGTDSEPGGGTGPAVAPPDNGKPQRPTPKGARRWLNDLGLYNPDLTAPELNYFSKVRMNVNYIADYPHWTRMVAMGGNLFDVFDQRTPDHASDVVGARAAVRWVDAVTGNPPEASLGAKPALTKKKFFAVEPYVTTEYAKRLTSGSGSSPHVPYSHSAPTAEPFGRFDFALLRCCDFDGETEKAAHLVYFRLFFKFVPQPGSTIFNAPADKAWARDFVINVGKRYNGKTGKVGTDAAERIKFLPRYDTTDKIEVDHIWFGQSLAKPECQYSITVEEPAPNTSPRAWFQGLNGTGSQGPGHETDIGKGFTGAHECGHGVGLTDDYCERWNAQSYGELSFRWHVPGDPFEPDGRITEFNEPEAAMMNGNTQIRNRYAWHCAEWSRRVSKLPLKVKLGNYKDYWLPAHSEDSRNYAFWPFAAKDTYCPAPTENRASARLALYAMGEEVYTKVGLRSTVCGGKGGTDAFDGMLAITIHLALKLPTYLDPLDASIFAKGYYEGDNRKKLLSAVSKLVRDGLNGRFVARGTVNKQNFKRCLIHFSPRFLDRRHHGTHSGTPNFNLVPGSEVPERASAERYYNQLGRDFDIEVVLDATSTGKEKVQFDPSIAEIPEIPTLAEWKAVTGAGGGARAPEDPELSTLDTAIDDYHKLHKLKWLERRDKLREIEGLCNSWEMTRSLMSIGEGESPEHAARGPGVDTMTNAAKNLHVYLHARRASRDLKLTVKQAPAVGAQLLADLVPAMIGVFKPMSELTAADLQSMVREVIPGATVSELT